MREYIKGKRAPIRGPRGKNHFDLVGAISADSRGALAEHSLNRPMYTMLDPGTSILKLREVLFGLHDVVRETLFDADPEGKEDGPIAWRRIRLSDCVLPPKLQILIGEAHRVHLDPRREDAKMVFALFEALVGLWAEARLIYDRERMDELNELITLHQNLVLADETFAYILLPFLAFLSFDGPDYPSSKHLN